MTDHQFRALHRRLVASDWIGQIRQCRRVGSPKKSTACDTTDVRRWLINSWNTEHILALSATVLEGASGAALQWTFPQAYYSAFASTLAFFRVAGFTQSSHGAVQRKFAELVLAGDYPHQLSFAATGTMKNMVFHRLLESDVGTASIHFDPDSPASVDRHIRQFLGSTRRMVLENKKNDLKLKTARGTIRERYKEEHWMEAADKVGPTSLLCLLYRKRLKSNYKDIDTFTSSRIDPTGIFKALTHIVHVVSLVHECYITAALGEAWFEDCMDSYLKNQPNAPLAARAGYLRQFN